MEDLTEKVKVIFMYDYDLDKDHYMGRIVMYVCIINSEEYMRRWKHVMILKRKEKKKREVLLLRRSLTQAHKTITLVPVSRSTRDTLWRLMQPQRVFGVFAFHVPLCCLFRKVQ